MRFRDWLSLCPAGLLMLWDVNTDIPVGWAQSQVASPDASVIYIVRLSADDPVYREQLASFRPSPPVTSLPTK